MNNLEYNKEYHFIDSPSVFWDLDTLIYLAILSLIIWGTIRLFGKIKDARSMTYPEYCARFLYTAYIPIFLFYFIPLLISGMFIPSNFIISFLPLVYGGIIQLIFHLVYRHYS